MGYLRSLNYNISKELAVDSEGFIFLSLEVNWFNERYYFVQDIINDICEDFEKLDDAISFFNEIVDPASQINY